MEGIVSPRVTSRKGGESKEVPEHLKLQTQASSKESVELFNAALSGSVLGVRNAIAKGGKVNYFHRPEDQKNSLHVASENGFKEIVLMLLENGAVVDCQAGSTKDTALILACHNGHIDVADILLSKGADVNWQNCYGNAPLHESAKLGDCALCNLLISEGAVLDIVNNKGSTPLHFFCYSDTKNIDIAQLLLDGGARLESRDSRGCTPALAAVINGKLELLKYFEAEGADMQARDDVGKDGLDLAAFHRLPEIERFLRNLAVPNGK